MDLKLIRNRKTEKSTIGDLYVNDVKECFILEDTDRMLDQSMPLDIIQKTKVNGATCIPYGRYEIIISFSNRFQKRLPLLLNVNGFDGIRMHPGNAPKDTLGCLLPGQNFSEDFVSNSRNAYYNLFEKIEKALQTEKVWIEIME